MGAIAKYIVNNGALLTYVRFIENPLVQANNNCRCEASHTNGARSPLANVCLSCGTIYPGTMIIIVYQHRRMRTLIFAFNGVLKYDWKTPSLMITVPTFTVRRIMIIIKRIVSFTSSFRCNSNIFNRYDNIII